MDATPDPEILEKLFRHKVLRLLQDEEAIDEQVVANLLAWPHTGFGAHLSREIPTDPVSRENVARYLAHSPIILDRIVGNPSAGKILYTGGRSVPATGPTSACSIPWRSLPRSVPTSPIPMRRPRYEVDPLLCSRCGATMKVIAVIEDAGFASPATPVSRELSYEPIHDDLPWPDPA